MVVPLGLYECFLNVIVDYHLFVLLHGDDAGGPQLLGYDVHCPGQMAHRKSYQSYFGIGQSHSFAKVVLPPSVGYDSTISHSLTGSYPLFALLSVDHDLASGVPWVAGNTPPPAVPPWEYPMDPVDWNSLDV